MNPTPLHRPLQPFENDALALASSQGWTTLTLPLESDGGLFATFTKDNQRLFLLVAPPSQEEGAGPRTAESLESSAGALAGALDLKVYDRIVFATDAALPEPLREALESSAVEVWTRLTMRRLRELRRSEGPGATPATLRVSSLRLRGFRGIVELDLQDLPTRGPVVFVGPNGVGKSTLLDAIAMALSWVPARIDGERRRGELPVVTDIHNDQPSGAVQLTADLGGGAVTWTVGRARKGGSASRLTALNQRLDELGFSGIDGGDLCVPLVVHYSVRRAAPRLPSSVEWILRGGLGSRTEGDLRGIRRGEANTTLAFFRWFRDQEDRENEIRLQEPGYRDVELSAARRAITAVMEGYTNLRMDRTANTIVLEKAIPGRSPTVLRFDQLSDGEKTLLGMVGDLASLLSILNPGLPDPLLGGGVVLIDEIELHLHPRWQREVVDRLRQTFPNVQFVLTTHSPQVISHVPTESIVLIQQVDGEIKVERPDYAQGWDSNRILSRLMGVSERPDKVKDQIAEVGALIDAERLEEATAALDRLESELGRFDGEVIRLRAVLDFLRD